MPELPEVQAIARTLGPLARGQRWHARIDPRRPANSLGQREAAKLHKAIVSVLRRALECCLHPAPVFRDPTRWFEGLEKILRTYQREGLPCKCCGRPIDVFLSALSEMSRKI